MQLKISSRITNNLLENLYELPMPAYTNNTVVLCVYIAFLKHFHVNYLIKSYNSL